VSSLLQIFASCGRSRSRDTCCGLTYPFNFSGWRGEEEGDTETHIHVQTSFWSYSEKKSKRLEMLSLIQKDVSILGDIN
jgi:hypothetical protein